MFSLSVAVAAHYETPLPYSGPLAGVFPLVPKAASGGLVPEFSPDVSAALAEFASLGGTVDPAPPISTSSSYPSSSYSSAPLTSTYISTPSAASSGSHNSYSRPLAGVPTLVPKAASGGLVPEFSPYVASALAEFALLGGNVHPAAPSSSYSSNPSSSYSSDVTDAHDEFSFLGGAVNTAPASYGSSSSSISGLLKPSSLGSSTSVSSVRRPGYTGPPAGVSGYTGPLAGVPTLVPAAASGALVPADEASVAAARAEHLAAKTRAANGW